ncbi:bacteriophage abortive infection AbiH family protein [Tenacibaculum haliotis]|uniref:bacteriophage abortive infection AbiH family protein n=1 Tax=Tenacibaculum haliotis TaxID=1888914 RepID=UPI0021AE5BD3|nr:bacteriophage abortive infection AbiH family protein [Tenacibaculum haliotis]MCT4699535.1 bacteriophage abortive infection AbiH family protein [Tenacibaculum haliotis]
MRINYIIGNGFDRNLNLKTSYKEFVNVYRDIKNDNPIIEKFKSTLKGDSELWFKLEEYLGDYTKHIKKPQEFILIYDDLQIELSNYLKNEQSNLVISKPLKDKIINDFINPQKYLSPNDKRRLISFIKKHSQKKILLNISTFNYTNSVEQIFNSPNFPLKINTKNIFNSVTQLENINHIHGLIDNGLIFGVNDESQISNIELSKNIEIQEHLIKPFVNDSYDILINKKLEQDIRNADLICLHGLSMGATDKKWWKIIGEEVKNGKHLVFHKFSEIGFSNLNRNKINPLIRGEKKRLLDLFEIPTELSKKTESQIYIEIGTKTFNNSK